MENTAHTHNFQAEIKQLLDILVHSLYTEREIFLRELVSNASDALNRVQFELLTNRDISDPDAALEIRIRTDEEAGTLTISDTGIGMTEQEMVSNLGTIARSGARAFIEAMQAANDSAAAQNVIGQFGVGFYSVFMVADEVRVVSKGYQADAPAVAWVSEGGDTYRVEPAERATRGTDIIITLKEDAKDFLQQWTLKDIIRRHSDYIAFPIYVGDDEQATNKQEALWRQDKSEVSDAKYDDFYRMMTLDFNPPLKRIHMQADVPQQFYALLYIPSSSDLGMLSPRKEPGLKLYARKVLIQEYNKDLLPEYLNFIQGVVDSEDLPLAVSRESVQASRVLANLKKTLTNKVLSELKRMAQKRREEYLEIYRIWQRHIKQGLIVSPSDRADIEALLFFASTHEDAPDALVSLDDYVARMAENQDDIYYILGDDFSSLHRSPHLDAFRQRGIEVLYFTDPVDPIMLNGLTEYKGHQFRSVDAADLDLSDVGTLSEDAPQPEAEALPEDRFGVVVARFKARLGQRVRDVRASKSLVSSPARLVSDEESVSRAQMFRINRLFDRDYELPVKILELNASHPLLHNLADRINGGEDAVIDAVVEQVFETALLQDGIHPDPAAMADRLTALMQAATGTPFDATGYTEPAQAAPADDSPQVTISGLDDAETDTDDSKADTK